MTDDSPHPLCAAVMPSGRRCKRPAASYGDGTLCGLHYHLSLRRETTPRPKSPRLVQAARTSLLLIERKESLRKALAEMMGPIGFQAVAVPTLDEGLALLTQRDFGLVLMDWIQLSGEPVWSAVELVVEYARPARVGVLSERSIDAEEARLHGVQFVARKPIVFDELVASASQHLTARGVSPERSATIHSYFSALTARDWDALVALCSADVEYHLPGTDPKFSTSIKGQSEFREFSETTFRRFPGARFTVDEILPLPEGGVARYRGWWGTKSEPVAGRVLFRFEQEKIAEIGVRVDVRLLA